MAKDLKTNLMSEKNIDILKKFMIFKRMNRDDIKRILSADRGSNGGGYQKRIAKMCSYGPGEAVIEEGEFDSWSFWVVTGSFDVIQNDRVIASFTRPGEIFGEMSVFEGIPRTASVISRMEGTCLCIDMSIIDNLKDERIETLIKEGFYAVMLKRIGSTKTKIQTVKKDLEARYAELLDFEKKIRKTTR